MEKELSMRQHWFEHVKKTRKRMSRGKETASHREAMKAASETWADAKAKIDSLTGIAFSLETARSWAVPDHKAIARLKKGVRGVSYHTLSKAEAAKFNAATQRSIEAFLAASEKKGVPARAIYKAVTTSGS